MELTDTAREFCRRYDSVRTDYADAASLAERLVSDALRDGGFAIHQVVARAKGAASLLRKVRRKGYGEPHAQVTDLVGVRVVTYFFDEVDPIVGRLRRVFEIDEARSTDKRAQLDVRAFGYRSVHLIVKAGHLTGIEGRGAPMLRDLWFEIQVRSILEHAWAEVEHDIVYKSGVSYPEAATRRFAALAAQLEELDRGFLALREQRHELISAYLARHAAGEDEDEALDAARLAAVLEMLRPAGTSFRSMEASGTSLPPGVESSCIEALAARGVRTARDLRAALDGQASAVRIENYASLERVTVDEVSHFALCVLAAAPSAPSHFADDFSDLLTDASLRECVGLSESDAEDD